MPDYKQGKIYKIIDDEGNIMLYGSTTLPLQRRWALYKSNWKGNHGGESVMCKYFNEDGFDNYSIELVEDYPCDNNKQLCIREDEYIRENDCVNEVRAYTSRKEKVAYHKIRGKIHYEKNKSTIAKRWAEKVVCECGREVTKGNLSTHRKTAYHLSRI